MEHVRLGRTGMVVSRLCLGTMTFGYQCDEDTSRGILDAAADAGITFLDTAQAYPLGGGVDIAGTTEEIVGRWMKGRRDDFIVATKCVSRVGPRHWDAGGSRKHIIGAIEGSLRRLQTDYVDLYQMHMDDRETPLDESLEALDDLVRAGKVRYIGCSNYLAYRVALALGRSEARRLVRFESVQPRYNLLFRQIERELLPLCADENIGVIPYNPLAGGLLTGKHISSAPPPEGTRFTLGWAASTYQDRYWHDRQFETVESLRRLATDAGMPLTTLAVAWVLANPVITSPIVGASRPEQLADNVAALGVTLDADLLKALDELTHTYRMGDDLR